jgi:UMF1 family MFS transporter
MESLDDPGEDEALERAFGLEEAPHVGTVIPRVNDHPTTTQRELWGWYLYEGANQPYSSVCISGYMPIIVNDMAKFYAATTADKCHVSVLGIKILPAAFASSMISLSVLLQAILFIGTSAMADYGSLRKFMLMFTAFLGAAFTLGFIFLTSSKLFILAGVLLMCSNILYGYALVFYNAYLAPIVRSIPEYLDANPEEQHDTFDRLTNKVSTRGFMFGYACGVFMLLVTVPIVLFSPKIEKREWWFCETGKDPVLRNDDDTSFAFRISIFLCGLWWVGLSIFSVFWIHARPGPPLPPHRNYISASITNVWQTMKSIKRLRHSFIFLIAYFLFSDAYTTISYVGILFAKNDMGAGSLELMILLAEVPLIALVGNFFFLWVKNKLKLESKTMIVINLSFLLILPFYSFLGFIPSSPIGMKKIWELFVFGAIYGFNIGSIQSFARTVFISLTPPGHESEFFGFYEITDKGSAWIGPAIVALLTEWTGQVRYSFFYLLVALLIPAIILRYVDVKEGTQQARAYSESENAQQMVDFGRLDSTTTDDDDGLVSLTDDFLQPTKSRPGPSSPTHVRNKSLPDNESLLEDEDDEENVSLEL